MHGRYGAGMLVLAMVAQKGGVGRTMLARSPSAGCDRGTEDRDPRPRPARHLPASHALALARSALATFAMPICPTAITQLHSHPYASAEGLTAQEREPTSRAAQELGAVWAFVKTSVLVSLDAGILRG